jgi:predicted GIY-YIG superfamily endonuclease
MPCKICKRSGHNVRTCSKNTTENTTENTLNIDGAGGVCLNAKRLSAASLDATLELTATPFMDATHPSEAVKRGVITPAAYCYILGQTSNLSRGTGKTYNGYTVNLKRRLRQHNGIIKGGAHATRGNGPWEFIAIMTCDNWTNVRAMQVEWLIRYPTRKKPRPLAFSGARGRIQSLVEICKRIDEISDIRLYIHPLYFDLAKSLGLGVFSLDMINGS